MRIIIPGEPVSQARMKFTSRGGFGRAYDPRAKQKAEIREFLKIDAKASNFAHTRISFVFHMKVPVGVKNREKGLYNSGMLKHNKKPDIDNLVKLYLDCLVGLYLEDDNAVSLGFCIKTYHAFPKTIILLEDGSPTLQCEDVGKAGWTFLTALEPDKQTYEQMARLPDYDVHDYSTFEQSPHNSSDFDGTEALVL